MVWGREERAGQGAIQIRVDIMGPGAEGRGRDRVPYQNSPRGTYFMGPGEGGEHGTRCLFYTRASWKEREEGEEEPRYGLVTRIISPSPSGPVNVGNMHILYIYIYIHQN